jgi:RimJ/RimL family protein N-acetyltransferase
MNRFALRPVQDDDHAWLVELHNDPVVLHHMTHDKYITIKEHQIWWDKVSKDPYQLRMVFTVDGCRAGFAKFYDIYALNCSCVLGADMCYEYRGKGYAKEMWHLMLEMCFNDFLLHRVSLTTAEYNHVGLHLYQKLGFIEEGRLTQSLFRRGEFHDQVCMYMLEDTWKHLSQGRIQP